jgi:hypothetical protein
MSNINLNFREGKLDDITLHKAVDVDAKQLQTRSRHFVSVSFYNADGAEMTAYIGLETAAKLRGQLDSMSLDAVTSTTEGAAP